MEAVRILNAPPVTHYHLLAIHLPDQQNAYFIDGHEEKALFNADRRDTHLTMWFKLNESNADACHLLHSEIPLHYTFDIASHRWKKRHKGGDKVITRMYAVNPSELEGYYLRIILLHIPGASDLKRVGNKQCKEVCQLLGLLNDDNPWHITHHPFKCLTNSEEYLSPYPLIVTLQIHSSYGWIIRIALLCGVNFTIVQPPFWWLQLLCKYHAYNMDSCGYVLW